MEAFPNVTEYRLALARTHYEWGQAHSSGGRLEKASASSEQARVIQARLVEEQPQIAEYRAALANTQIYLGGAYRQQGKRPQAEAALAEALKNNERLVRDYPDAPDYHGSLASTHGSLGLLYYEARQYEPAEAKFRQALQIYEKLAREHPDLPTYASSVGACHHLLGSIARMQGKLDVALASYDKAIAIYEALMEKEPRSLNGRNTLCTIRLKRAMILAQRGEHARAVQEAEALAASQELNGVNLYNLACVYARAAAAKDEKLPSAERSQLQDRYAAKAVDSLRQAVAKEWRNLPLLHNDGDLDPVRGRADFKKLVQELEEKTRK